MKQKRRQLCWKVYPSFPSRRPSADRRTLPRRRGKSLFFRFFSIFFASKKTSKKTIVKKLLFSHFFAISARPGVDFWPFSVPKRVPGGYFFGVFSKTAISSKSRSRLGNNTIFEGRTVRKSVRRATPDGDGEKKRQKSLPAPSPDALFRLRARFLSIFASRPGPENRQKTVPEPTYT